MVGVHPESQQPTGTGPGGASPNSVIFWPPASTQPCPPSYGPVPGTPLCVWVCGCEYETESTVCEHVSVRAHV